MVSLSFIVTLAGYGCVGVGRVWLCGYGFWQGFMQVEGRESEREKHFKKSSSSLPFACAGKKKLHSAVQNGTVQGFFFVNKRKKFGSDPKMGYDRDCKNI
jgi:hypothetical protein